jgi:hypothetical protein
VRVTGQEAHGVEPRREPTRRSFVDALEQTATAQAALACQRRSEGPALPELREAVRAIPPAIWAGRVGGGSVLELAFGRDLTVELRQVADGIELQLRASAGLARAARVDLPALVDALRARGVTVVRAEVRGGSRAGARRKGP